MKNETKKQNENTYVEKVLMDLVCGMELEKESSFVFVYKGKEYHFCSEHCKIHFEDAPEKYAGV